MIEVKDLVSRLNIKIPSKLEAEAKILVIEDQTDMRLIIVHHLNKLGFKSIKQFSNGLEALEWLRASSQDVAITICDQEMPVMGGFDFLDEVKADRSLSRGPFAICIDNPDRAKIMLATESGVDGILVKPFTLKDVIPKLREAFKIYHNPNNPELLYQKAKDNLRDDKLDEAEAIYKALSAMTEKAARPIVGLADVALLRKDYAAAEKLLQQAEERNKNYVHTYVIRGNMYGEQNKIEEAIAEFKKAIDLSPLNPVRYERAAELLFSLKKFEEAVEILSVALKNELEFPSLHHYLSQAYYSLKNYKKAIRHIRSSLNADPENISYLNQLGIAYKESDEVEEALKTYNQVIKLDPENRAALYNKAILLKSKGDVDGAIKLLDRCLTKHPDFAQAKEKLNEFKSDDVSKEAAS